MADFKGKFTGKPSMLDLASTEGDYEDAYGQDWKITRTVDETTSPPLKIPVWHARLVQHDNLYGKGTTQDVVSSESTDPTEGGNLPLLQSVDDWVDSWKKEHDAQAAGRRPAPSGDGGLAILALIVIIALVASDKR